MMLVGMVTNNALIGGIVGGIFGQSGTDFRFSFFIVKIFFSQLNIR